MYNVMTRIMLDLYDQFVDYKSNFTLDEGIYFIIKLTGSNFGYEKDGNTFHKEWVKNKIKFFHIIFLSHRNVFVSISDKSETPDPEKWENTSNHDSCFRSDGVANLSALYFKMNDYIFEEVPEEHKQAPIMGNVRMTLNHNIFNGPVFKFIKVKRVPDNSYNHYCLTSIKTIEKTITVKK